MEKNIKKQFVESWGVMGSVWGVNTSIARIHALLMVSEKPLGLDDISKKLNISRGNASMCLKELRNWGVIQKISVSGDRKDYYVSENDVWKMLFRIDRERKKREFDPALETVEKALASSASDPSGAVKDRLQQMKELMSALDSLASKFLKNEDDAKAALALLTGLSKS